MKPTTTPRRWRREWIALALLIVFHGVNNWLWLQRDATPPSYDQSFHMIVSLRFFDFLHGPILDALGQVLALPNRYAPLFQLSTSLSYWLRGTGEDVASFHTTLFLALALLSTYALGSRLFSPPVGIMAAFLLSMYQAVFGLSRQYLHDVPLMVFSAGLVYFLVSKKPSPGNSLGSGLTLGLGMLTKIDFSFFAVGPLLYRLLEAKGDGKGKWWLLTSLVVGAAVALPWYLASPQERLFGRSLRPFTLTPGDLGIPVAETWRPESLVWYATQMVDSLSPPFFALFLLGLALLLLRRRTPGTQLLFWMGGAYIILTLLPPKEYRHLVPVFPAVALATAYGLFQIPGRLWRRLALAATILWALLVYFSLTWAWRPPVFENSLLDWRPSEWTWTMPPQTQPWPVAQIVTDIQADSPNPRLTVIPNSQFFSPITFSYYITLMSLKIPLDLRTFTPDYLDGLLASDYLVAKTGDQGPSDTTLYSLKAIQALAGSPELVSQRFRPWRDYPLPDRSKATVYKKMPLLWNDAVSANFGGRIEFLGYALSHSSIKAGEPFQIRYRWQALAPITTNYSIFVHFGDASGRTWFQQDHAPCDGNCPTGQWRPGTPVEEEYLVTVPQGTPPGEYQILIGIYSANGRLPLLGEAAGPGENRLLLGRFQVK